jgi:superfamily II DNA or RNA helicase
LSRVQASWTPDAHLFCWAVTDPLEVACAREASSLLMVPARATERQLAVPAAPHGRLTVPGIDVALADALPFLVGLNVDNVASDSLRCWSAAAKLALRLAMGQQVAPTVVDGRARWRALFVQQEDQDLLDQIIEAMPLAGRAVPTTPAGPVLLVPSETAVRAFIDRSVDVLYRRGVWPGPALGWVRDFAHALTGSDDTFAPREARFQTIPIQLASWAAGADATSLVLDIRLELPRGRRTAFPLRLWGVAAHDASMRVPLAEAWSAGQALQIGDSMIEHPAYSLMRGLSRASRLWRPLAAALGGSSPVDLDLDPSQVWDFLSKGVPALRGAGIRVRIPPEFETSGDRRIRARMRIETNEHSDGTLDAMFSVRWEVALGERLIDGEAFRALLNHKSPVVRYEDQWVILDPAEVLRLPKDLGQTDTLPAAEALRAVLTGEHRGIPVVADQRLDLIIQALREPPEAKVPAGFRGTLRPYQVRGYSWLATLGRLGLGACLADDMGLGKTVQLIAHMLERRGRPHLVVCPTSVLGNWRREINRFAPDLKVHVHHGVDRRFHAARRADIVLTSYGLLVRDLELLQGIAWDVVALDEAQSIKNPDSQRAKAARAIKARHRIALSGTPVENRLEELWSIMEFLVPGLLGTRRAFERNVAVPIERFGDEAVARNLKLGVSPFLLRRVKSDPTIIDDLPEKIERKDFVPLTSEQARLYQVTADEYMERIANAGAGNERRAHVLALLTKLKQVCNHPDQLLKQNGKLAGRSGKLERFGELIELIVDGGERAIVFTQYTEMGDRLVRYLREDHDLRAPFLYGGTPAHHREEMVRAFQEDERACPILVISLKAGGTGLNLTRATHVIHYDRWWNPAVEDQATDRAYRIGQKRNVQVHKLIAQGTLEERIDKLLEDKRALADQVVGSGESLIAELDDNALRLLVTLGDDALVEDDR